MKIKNIIGLTTDEKIRNFTLFLVFGNLCYSLFPFQPIVWRLLLTAIAILCICRDMQKTNIEKAIFVFILMNVFYFFIAWTYSTPRTTTIGNTLSAFSTLYIFSYLNRKRTISDTFITISLVVLFIGCLVYYRDCQMSILERLGKDIDESATINASSVFLYLIPLLFYIKKKWLSISVLMISLFFILTAVKRGNIVAAVIPTILFLLYNFTITKRNLIQSIAILGVVTISYRYLKDVVINNAYFMHRLQLTLEGNSSNRDVLYSNALDVASNSSLFRFIFGNGFDSTLTLLGIHAHSDWLEILVDFGVVGVVIYLLIFINIYSNYKNTDNKISRYVIISCASIWLLKSIYSMAFTGSWMMILMIPFAIAITSKNEFE